MFFQFNNNIMKSVHFLLFLLIAAYYSPYSYSKIVRIQGADFNTLNQQLSLQLEQGILDKAKGFYRTEQGMLHGNFDLGEEYTGHDVEQNAFYLYRNKVKGSFNKGRKHGVWQYSFVSDDGMEIFERHEITIHYKNGHCIKGHFKGVIGHLMPITQHNFSNLRLCSPLHIREQAWLIWSEHYQKHGAKSLPIT